MEDILTQLVAMRTISDDTAANEQALDYIESYLTQRGMHTKRFVFEGHGALIATTKPDEMAPKIMLYGHVDVMLGSDDMFSLRRDGDKLIGRGVYDMKFAIVAYMQAVDTIKDKLTDYDFGIMIVTDEEYGGRDGVNGAHQLLNLGYRSQVCVMPDGARDWNVEEVAKGFWRFDLIAEGKTAHASRPWEGDSASLKLIQALHDLRARFVHQSHETDTLNVGSIYGDGTYNQIPAKMTAAVELRLANEDSLAKQQAFIEEICERYGLRYVDRTSSQPLRQDLSHPLIQAYMDSVESVRGVRPVGCMSLAASDAAYFNEVGVPCILTYITGGGHHSEHEWIEAKSLAQFGDVILDYLERSAKRTAPVDTPA